MAELGAGKNMEKYYFGRNNVWKKNILKIFPNNMEKYDFEEIKKRK